MADPVTVRCPRCAAATTATTPGQPVQCPQCWQKWTPPSPDAVGVGDWGIPTTPVVPPPHTPQPVHPARPSGAFRPVAIPAQQPPSLKVPEPLPLDDLPPPLPSSQQPVHGHPARHEDDEPDEPERTGGVPMWAYAAAGGAFLLLAVVILAVVLRVGSTDEDGPGGTRANKNKAEVPATPEGEERSLLQSTNIGSLTTAVKSGAMPDRVAAAQQLGKLGQAAQSAIPTLLAVVDEDPELDIAVEQAVAAIGPPAPTDVAALGPALSRKSAVVRRYAARELAASNVPDSVIPALAAALADAVPEVRVAAAEALTKAGPRARVIAIGPLLDHLADANPAVITAVTIAIGKLGPFIPEDKPIIAPKLDHQSATVREFAAALIASLMPTAEQAVKVWGILSKDPVPERRAIAIRVLVMWPDQLREHESAVLRLLTDPDRGVRLAAVGAVARMKPTMNLTDHLAMIVQSETDPEIRAAAGEAFAEGIDPTRRDLPVLRKILAEGTPKGRRGAANKLARLQDRAMSAVPDLVARLADPDIEVRTAVLRALAAVGVEAERAIPDVSKILADPKAPEPLLLGAVDVLGATGAEGLWTLKKATTQDATTMFPTAVRARMCVVFAKAGAEAADMFVWMLDQAETVPAAREPTAEAFVRSGTDAVVRALVRRTDRFRPRVNNTPEQEYPGDYRRWALETLGKMDVLKVATPATREILRAKLESLSRDMDAELKQDAIAIRKRLKL